MMIQEKAERIIKDIKKEKGNNPIQIFKAPLLQMGGDYSLIY